jgi:surface protein
VDVSGFNTENVKALNDMFNHCESLEELYLGSFDTHNVTRFYRMFEGCKELKTVFAGEKWTTENNLGTYAYTSMFTGCDKLTGGKGTSLASLAESGMIIMGDTWLARIDEGPENPGLFTADTNGTLDDETGQTMAYTVLYEGTLTFYYDNKVNSRVGYKYRIESSYSDGKAASMPGWYLKRNTIKKAVFDQSFRDYRPTSTAFWFYNCAFMTSVVGMENLNTSQVTNMSAMFRFCYILPSLDVSRFDTSNVTDMSYMFCYCSAVQSLDMTQFKTDKVVDMQHMFHTCPVTELDLRSFDTSNVKQMSLMFCECNKVKTIYASDTWSTDKVKYSAYMFNNCKNLVGGMGTKFDSGHTDHEYARIDGGLCDPGYLTGEYNGTREPYAVLDDKNTLTFYYDWNKNCRDGEIFDIREDYNEWEIGSFSRPEYLGWSGKQYNKAVFDPSFAEYYPKYTFYWFCNNQLKTIENIHYLHTDSVIDMSHMFESSRVDNLDLSHFNTGNVQYMYEMFSWSDYSDLDLSSFDTSKVKDMSSMFRDCRDLEQVNLSSFTAESLERMPAMFMYCISLKQVKFRDFKTKKVTNMSSAFYNCYSLEEVDLSSFDTSNVENMRWMFSNCRSLQELNLSTFYTPKVVDMSCMFSDCGALKTLDIRNFDTSKTADMSDMFFCCKALEDLDVTSFRTPSLTNISSMFHGCESLTNLDLSRFKTDKLELASELFYDCKSLREIDLSGFYTKNVTNMMYMFHNCESLKTIYTSDLWGTEEVIWGGEIDKEKENNYYMLLNCTNLVGGAGTTFDGYHVGINYAHIDGGPSNPGYFTYKEYDETKGVEDVQESGRQSEAIYNLQGIRLKEPVKGLYIKNGKKIMAR